MDAVLDHARGQAATRVTLWIDVSNGAGQRLFASRAFHATGRSNQDEAGERLMLERVLPSP